MAAVTQIPRQSDEFARVEHLLQLSARSTAVKDVAVWAVSNPTLNLQFERRGGNGGLLTLDSWVDVNALDAESNAVADVCRRGFALPEGGAMEVAVGTIRFPENGQTQHQYLLCSAAVGRAYVIDEADGGERRLPQGYDSIYLHSAAEAAAAEAAAAESAAAAAAGGAYRHRYVLPEAAQVLPRYVVHFTYDAAAERAGGRKAIDGINLSDIKSRIAETLAVLGPAAAAATEKMLTDIGDAYDAALAASRAADPLLEERRASVREALEAVDTKLAAIQANSHAVEEELFARMQAAMFQLQDETQRKMNALLSEELELRRQLGQIEWNAGFAAIMQQTLPPMTFVAAWERQAALKQSLYAALGGRVSTRALDEVQADLSLHGSIDVLTRPAAAARAAAAAAAAASAAAASAAAAAVPSPASAGAAAAPMASTSGGAPAAVAPPQAVNDIWASVLRGNTAATASGLPLPPPPPPQAQLSSSPGGGSSLQSAQTRLAEARASLAALEATAAALPRDVRAQADAARAQAQARVAECEATVDRLLPASARFDSSVPASATAAAATPAAAPKAASVPLSASVASAANRSAGPSSRSSSASASSSSSAVLPPLEQRVARFSLRREAERKRRQRGLEIDPALAFSNSGIVTAEQAATLYTCLPFGHADDGTGLAGGAGGLGSAPPVTRCLYASALIDPATMGPVHVQGLLSAYMQGGAGEASVVLLRANGQVFGGYAADAWDLASTFGGTPRSFLFSLSKDCKVPYTGRVKGPRQASDDELRRKQELANAESVKVVESMLQEARRITNEEPKYDDAGRLLLPYEEAGQVFIVPVPVPRPRPFMRHDCLRSAPEGVMQFGVGDLVLCEGLDECRSELELSYGMGLRPEEARTFLAGAPVFKVDAVELWAVSATPPLPPPQADPPPPDSDHDRLEPGAFGEVNFSTPLPGGRLDH